MCFCRVAARNSVSFVAHWHAMSLESCITTRSERQWSPSLCNVTAVVWHGWFLLIAKKTRVAHFALPLSCARASNWLSLKSMALQKERGVARPSLCSPSIFIITIEVSFPTSSSAVLTSRPIRCRKDSIQESKLRRHRRRARHFLVHTTRSRGTKNHDHRSLGGIENSIMTSGQFEGV